MRSFSSTCMTPNARRLRERHLHAPDAQVRAALRVLLEHHGVVHLVDVVPGEDDDVLRVLGAQDVEVLPDGVRGAAVPHHLVDALLRGKQIHELVQLGAQEVPRALDVAEQAVRLVLREDVDPAHAGVDAVREREIDDPILAAKVNGRFRSAVREVSEPGAAASGEDQCHRSRS